MHVEEPLVVVHPDLGHTSRVDPMRVVGDEVWMEWTEDVTNVAGEREVIKKGIFWVRNVIWYAKITQKFPLFWGIPRTLLP